MAKQTINIFICDFIWILDNQPPLRKNLKTNFKTNFFDWKLQSNKKPIFEIEKLQIQLIQFITKYHTYDINLIIDGFSGLIVSQIYMQIKHYISKWIILNPFDQLLYLRSYNIKSKFLPVNTNDVVFKYIYLFHDFKLLRSNPQWTDALLVEKKHLFECQLIYHKIFDQILKFKNIKNYHKFLKFIEPSAHYIIGSSNPIANISKIGTLIDVTKLHVINDCGFCLNWEKPQEVNQIISNFLATKHV